MKTAALVPLKRWALAKGRLRDALPPGAVEELGRAMLEDVLAALRESSVAAVYTLTEDPAVAEAARAAGSQVRMQVPDPGLNPVLDLAEQQLSHAGFDASLVVLGDLPLITSRDVDAVLASGQEHRVVIVPASDGGTAMLWRRPPGCIPSRFGPHSAHAHACAARQQRIHPQLLTDMGLLARTDLDTLEDARRLREGSDGSRTVALLRRLLP